MYYIYAFLDPRKPGNYIYGDYCFEYEPFYIGKGKGNRINNSLYKDLKKNKNQLKSNKIKSIVKNRLDIISVYLHQSIESEDVAFGLEKKLISLIGRITDNTGPLCNICLGGEGISGYKHNSERLAKIGLKSKGRKISESHKHKISIANKGRIKSPEECREISIRQTGRKLSPETKAKLSLINSKPKPENRDSFEVTSPTGEVQITNSLQYFCIMNKLNYNSMTALSRGKRKSGNHLGWKCKKI